MPVTTQADAWHKPGAHPYVEPVRHGPGELFFILPVNPAVMMAGTKLNLDRYGFENYNIDL